jgi:hypothetical protein
VIAKAQAILSEPALQRAMFDVGYFPPNTPPHDSAPIKTVIPFEGVRAFFFYAKTAASASPGPAPA